MSVYNRGGVSYRKSYRIKKGRLFSVLLAFVLIIVSAVLIYKNHLSGVTNKYSIHDFDSHELAIYFTVGREQNIPWYYLAAIDRSEGISGDEVNEERSKAVAAKLIGINEAGSGEPIDEYIRTYKDDGNLLKLVKTELKKLEDINRIYKNKVFPLDMSYEYTYEDGFGDDRTYGGQRQHEGTDIMCDMEVPVVSVCDGVVEQVGWLELGGWRIGIRGEDGIYYYYAHLSRYEGFPDKGDKVSKGEVIGYSGDSGYGEKGTTGQFAPHLHFGMYAGKGKNMKAFNPYPFLKAWEKR